MKGSTKPSDPVGRSSAKSVMASLMVETMMTEMMSEAMKPLGIPVHTVDRFDNGGLLRAKMPSVLVEAVFLSNPGEAKKLADGTRQDDIAVVIASGIATWMHDET